MGKFKDWKEGEARIKAHVVTPQGGTMDLYMPRCSAQEGLATVVLLSRICGHLPVKIEYVDEKTGEVVVIDTGEGTCAE
jgi:hypothetical protein